MRNDIIKTAGSEISLALRFFQKCAHFWTVTLRAVQSDPYDTCAVSLESEILPEINLVDGTDILGF